MNHSADAASTTKSVIVMSKTKLDNELRTITKNCSCGIATADRNNHINNNNLVGFLTPRLALGGEILQASLSIAPAAHYSMRDPARFHVATLAMDTANNNNSNNIINSNNNIKTVSNGSIKDHSKLHVKLHDVNSWPTRHSKSLDQLESQLDMPKNSQSRTFHFSNPNHHNLVQNSNNNNNIIHSFNIINSNSNNNANPIAVKKSSTSLISDDLQIQRDLHKNETEDLLKNINEFREKYKNPVDTFGNSGGGGAKKVLLNGLSTNLYLEHQIATLNRNLDHLKIPNQDYLHESTQQNRDISHQATNFNSLPKGSSLGLKANGRNTNYHKKRAQNGPAKPSESTNGYCSTLPRSHSSHALKNKRIANGKIRTCSDILKFNSCNRLSKSSQGIEPTHSSTSSSENELPLSSCSPKTAKRREKRLLSSASVPFKLEKLERLQRKSKKDNCESLPNLAPPPPEFVTSPFFRPRISRADSHSTSSLSDQSGWVSSRRSSLGQPSSPDVEAGTGDKILNGEQLRYRLQKLLKQQPNRFKTDEGLVMKRSSVIVK